MPSVEIPIECREATTSLISKGSSGTGSITCESFCRIKGVNVRPSASTSFDFTLYRDSSMNKPIYIYDKSAADSVGIIDTPDILYVEDGSDGKIYYKIENDSGGFDATFSIELMIWSGAQG